MRFVPETQREKTHDEEFCAVLCEAGFLNQPFSVIDQQGSIQDMAGCLYNLNTIFFFLYSIHIT